MKSAPSTSVTAVSHDAPTWQIGLAVAVGGAVGALLRAGWVFAMEGHGLRPIGVLPYPTLFINVMGSAALGGLLGYLKVRGSNPSTPVSPLLRPFLGTGVLGGFTTFSAYTVHLVLLSEENPLGALAYLFLTPFLCIGGAALGFFISQRLLNTPTR